MNSTLIEIRNAEVYLQGNRILSQLNWTMQNDQNWAIIGNNGAGKTTFMKLVFGELIPAHGGLIRWFGFPELTPLEEIRKKTGYVSAEFQNCYTFNLAGWEVVASGLYSSVGIYHRITREQKRKALAKMEWLRIGRLANYPFRRMSYGEARRILLARALVNDPLLLVLDEPCAGLDIPTRESFLEAIEKISSTNTRVIYVSHHIEEILPSITHVLYLKNGRILAQGEKCHMLNDKVLSEALGCRISLTQNHDRYWITGAKTNY